jgi:hypothetical protein
MFPRSTQACSLTARRRLALGGLAVTTALVAGAFVSTPAFAVAPFEVSTIGELHSALADHEAKIVLTASLDATPASADPEEPNARVADTETVLASTTIDLNGHTLNTDEVVVADGAELTVTDSQHGSGAESAGALDVQAQPNGSNPVTAISLGTNSTLNVSGAIVGADGEFGGAGIGAATASTGAKLIADGGAQVNAQGGTQYTDPWSPASRGGAGIGGAVGAAGIDVTIGDALVYAYGGPGAAGVGGGAGGAGGQVHLESASYLKAQQGSTFGDPAFGASSIGAGQGDAPSFGSLTIEKNAYLTVQDNAPLVLPDASAVVENQGDLALVASAAGAAVVKGTGTIHNLGTVRASTHVSDGAEPEIYTDTDVDPSTLIGDATISGHNYLLTVDGNGGTLSGATTAHLYSGSVYDLAAVSSVSDPNAATTFWKWNTAADGSGADVVDDLAPAGLSTGAPLSVKLFAKYAKVPYATTTSLPAGTVGKPYSAPIPVAGDGLSEYFVSYGNSSNDVHPGLPDGLSINSTTGLISGTPTEAVNRDVTFYVQGVGGADITFHLTIVPAAVAVTPQAPVISSVPKHTVKLGQALFVTLSASGDKPVDYSVTSGSLPKGISLNAGTGVISGSPSDSGTFTAVVTAKNAAGSSSTVVVIVVPEVKDLIDTTNHVPAVKVGAALVPLHVAGLKKGEHWTVKVDGEVVEHGTMKKAGTLAVSVHLKKALRDKVHTITIAGSRKITDKSTQAATTVKVTSLAAKKTLKVHTVSVNGMKLVAVEKLAIGEQVVIKDGSKVIAKGHANAYGIFVFPQSKAGKGTSKLTVHGAAMKRAGKLTVKNPKH